jgi:hypothetical protein
MSQVQVERVIGQLATDEALRRRFSSNPREVLEEMVRDGAQLNDSELLSLASLDPGDLARFAKAIGPRLQRVDLSHEDAWA